MIGLYNRIIDQILIWQSHGYLVVVLALFAALFAGSVLWSWSISRQVRRRISELTDILDLIPEQIFIKDVNGRYVLANQAVAEAYGTTVEKMIGAKDSFFHDSREELEIFRREDLAVIRDGKPRSLPEMKFTDARRKERVLQVIKIPYRLPGKNEIAALGVALDITARKQAEEALRESRRELREVIDAVPAMIGAKSRDSRYVFMNRYQAELYGVTPDTAVDRTAAELLGLDYGRRTSARDRKVFATGDPIAPYDEDWIDARGRKHNLLKTKVPIRDHNNVIKTLVTVALDITERKRAEEAQQQAKEEAERANLTKSRFLAAASHDLRQPLQTMRLLLTALRGTRDEGDRRDTVEEMAHALAIMDSVLNALLDNSMLDAGTIVPEIAEFRVDGLIHRIHGVYGPLSREKGVELRIVTSDLYVRSDTSLVERVVENFVSNAIRYTDEGKVLIGCRRRRDKLRIEVWDSGRGIPADQREAIFDEFYQVDNPERDHRQGLGLGLAIGKRIADILDHRIEVTSTLGKGSMFAVELPLAQSKRRLARSAVAANVDEDRHLSGLVLVIEDNPSVLNAMRRLLNLWGNHAVTAKTRREALALIEQAGVRPDLAIADYRLPDGQGAEVLRTLQRIVGGRLPGIIVSGDTSPTMYREAEAAGLSVLQKPVDPDELHAVMHDLLSARGAGATPRGQGAPPEPPETTGQGAGQGTAAPLLRAGAVRR